MGDVRLFLTLLVATTLAGSMPQVAFHSYRGAAFQRPQGVAAGPDGALWFAGEGSDMIGRIDNGRVTAFADPAVRFASALAPGADGALWFLDGTGAIGRITVQGAVTTYAVPDLGSPVGLAAGPDGALWYTTGGKSVGRLAQDGSSRLFVDPVRMRGTYGITAGPDGALWFTNYLGSSIGRIGVDGSVTTFADPGIRYPTGITTGPDGALWFADDSGSVGRITTAGAVTTFATGGHPAAITAGPGRALWVADRAGVLIRVTTTGRVTRYSEPGGGMPVSIAAAQGALWMADYGANAIVRAVPGNGGRGAPKPAAPKQRVTFVSDSVGAAVAFDTGAKAILGAGVDLALEPGQARRLGGTTPPGEIAPPTVLELIQQLGSKLGPTVIVSIGVNDVSADYAQELEAALAELNAAGVRHVLWATIHEKPNHTGFEVMNSAIADAALHHPELRVLDWAAYSSAHPEWFQADGVHLQGDGPRAFARFLHDGLVQAGLAH